jgi:hypothetical protein
MNEVTMREDSVLDNVHNTLDRLDEVLEGLENNESLEDLELRLHVLSTNLEVLDDALNLNRRLEVPLEAVLDQHERHVTFGLDLDFGPGGASVVE